MLQVVLCSLFALPLAAMEAAPSKEKKIDREKFHLQSVIKFDGSLLGGRLWLKLDFAKKNIMFSRNDGFWITPTHIPIDISQSFSSADQLIRMRTLGVRELSKQRFLGAAIATCLDKERAQKEICFLAQIDDKKQTTQSTAYEFDGKLTRVKFAAYMNKLIEVTFHSHDKDEIAKKRIYLDPDTLAEDLKSQKVQKWRKVKE